MLFVYDKSSKNSIQIIGEYIKNYHKLIGDKFFPKAFIQIEQDNTQYDSKRELKEITMNDVFPTIKIQKNFDKNECCKIINTILEEIKKEKNDDFPYSLAYQTQMNLSFCVKHYKFFGAINIFIFFLILFFCFLDTAFLMYSRDFINERRKIDDVFFGLRLNVNAINFILTMIFIKYSIFNRDKAIKMKRLEKYVLIVNFVAFVVQIGLHLRIRHVN